VLQCNAKQSHDLREAVTESASDPVRSLNSQQNGDTGQVVGRRLDTSAVRIKPQNVPCEIFGEQVAVKQTLPSPAILGNIKKLLILFVPTIQ
jgi:hypothetical protein